MTLFWVSCFLLNFTAWFVANVLTIYSEYRDAKTGRGKFDVSEVLFCLFINICPFINLACILYKSSMLIPQILGTTVSDIVTKWIRGEK